MSLQDLLAIPDKVTSSYKEDTEITPELILKDLDRYCSLIAYWRIYPDKFIDYMCSLDPNCHFKFYFYQRMALRCFVRYKNVYATFVRAWSKSFMSVMALMCKAILYPGAKLFSVAGGKQQSAEILKEKVNEICNLIPPLANEIIWDTRGTRAETHQTKDSVKYTFKNGSTVENIAATENTRGRRFHSGLMEECVGIDQEILNEVIIPTLNVNRPLASGGNDPKEILNKSQIFINFCWRKFIKIDA